MITLALVLVSAYALLVSILAAVAVARASSFADRAASASTEVGDLKIVVGDYKTLMADRDKAIDDLTVEIRRLQAVAAADAADTPPLSTTAKTLRDAARAPSPPKLPRFSDRTPLPKKP